MELTLAGKILSAHGLSGHVIALHSLSGNNPFSQIKFIFIEIRKGSYIPYFILQKRKISDTEMLLLLEDVKTIEDAKKLSGKNIYLETIVFEKLNPQQVSDALVGYEIRDENAGRIGAILSLFETPGQVLASVKFNNKEILIPLIDATLKSINHRTKEILVNLPDGLLEI